VSPGQRLLVLGADGFLGSHLVAAAEAAGLTAVAACHRPRGGALACDLLETESIAACLETARPDLVINAAGSSSVGQSWERPAASFAVNATGVLNLLEGVAAQAPEAHVLCLSSADVYGARDPYELPLSERLQLQPVTPYGAGKAAMEALCGQYSRGRGLRIAVARVFNLVGPGQSPEFAIPGFARRIAAAEAAGEAVVEVALGNPEATRDFVDVGEGAGLLLELSRRQLAGTYNLCSGRGTTMAELVEQLAAQASVEVRWRPDAALQRPADPPALVGDPERLREAVGRAPTKALDETLAGLLDHWRRSDLRD
jgi:GDP-4-dehydro-6-deoxy-D-mannose reductase